MMTIMVGRQDFQVVDADRMEEGIVITFADGVTAQFSGALLRQLLTDAKIITAEPESEEGPD